MTKDHPERADSLAFGLLLHEMATGRELTSFPTVGTIQSLAQRISVPVVEVCSLHIVSDHNAMNVALDHRLHSVQF
jgi:hypothetical protein